MTLSSELAGRFTPLDSVNVDNIPQLSERTRIEHHRAGETLFRSGDNDKYSCFLVEGVVELVARDGRVQRIAAGTEQARYALANLKPRQYDGAAVTESTILWIDTVAIDTLLAWDHISWQRGTGMTVREYDKDNGWALSMLQSSAFLKLPTASIEKLIDAMEPVIYRATDIVIHQNDPADYYYLIREGRCEVSRRNEKGAPTKIVELGPGDCFGEQALISDGPRNATVTMLTDGLLMRLAKKDFKELLEGPLIRSVTSDEARKMLADSAVLLDVRTEAEYEQHDQIEGSVNIPLFLLRLRLPKLDRGKRYIVYCDSGARSAAAVFVMTQRDYDAYLLEGGIGSLVG